MDKSSKPVSEHSTMEKDKTSNAGRSNKVKGIMFIIEEMQNDPHKMAFAVGILVGLLTLFLLFIWSRRGGLRALSKRGILILGPCDAGKTLLFNQLVQRKPIETFTSMIENVGQYFAKAESDLQVSSTTTLGKMLNVYDVPGHDRLRYSALDKRKEEAKAILYVIDASTLKQNIRDSAEFLFNILRDSSLHSASTPVLVVCNKQDLGFQAKGAGVIERELAKEIGLLRVTKSKLLQDSSGTASGNQDVYLGQEEKDFEFSDLKAEVTFLEASAAKDFDDEASGIPAIQQWIASKA